MKCRLWALSVVLLATLTSPQSLAQSPFPCTLATTGSPSRNISPAPTPRPSILERPKLIAPIGCNRPFLYHGEIYSVDSPQAADAGNLKYFTRDTALSQVYLSQYQENRERSRVSAYAGSAGIFLALFSSGIGRSLQPRNPKPIQNACLLLGSAIAIEGISYSIMLLRQNESLLTEAVKAHNEAKPKDSVELQFSTGWSF